MFKRLSIAFLIIFCCIKVSFAQEYIAGIKGTQIWARSELGSIPGYGIMIQNDIDDSVGLQVIAFKDGHFQVETSPLGIYMSDNGTILITDTSLPSFTVGGKTYSDVHYTKHKAKMKGVFTNVEHCIYQSTFLRNVELQISYHKNKEFEGWMINAMAKWISNETESKLTKKEYSLIVLNPNYLFVFKENKCLCRFNPSYFKTFNDAISLLNENKELLIELFNNKVKGSILKTTNILSAERTNDDSDDFSLLLKSFQII